jgi:hypothetical protein
MVSNRVRMEPRRRRRDRQFLDETTAKGRFVSFP